MLNVVCTQGVWRRYRQVARNAAGMVIRGLVERQDGVTNLVADKISSLDTVNPDAERALHGRHQSRNFH
jgi:error-prone DNA polymerase